MVKRVCKSRGSPERKKKKSESRKSPKDRKEKVRKKQHNQPWRLAEFSTPILPLKLLPDFSDFPDFRTPKLLYLIPVNQPAQVAVSINAFNYYAVGSF